MRKVHPSEIGFDTRGTIVFCPNIPGKECGAWVFQGVRAGLGNLPHFPDKNVQMRRYVDTVNMKTPAQLHRQALFANAVHDWQNLSAQDWLAWRNKGEHRRLPGYQAYISWRLTTI